MSGTGSHRRSLTEEIHRMTYNATEEDFEFLDETSRDAEEAAGFRHHAFRTQSDQNLILRMYEGFCQMRKRLPLGEALERMDEKDKQLAIFPKDLKLIAIGSELIHGSRKPPHSNRRLVLRYRCYRY